MRPVGAAAAASLIDARHVARPSRHPHRDRRRLDRLRPVVRARVLRVVVRLPAQRPARRRPHDRIRDADYLYISHLHGDHFDEAWLADERNVRRDIAVLVPGYPSRELDARLRALGFDNLIRTTDGEEHRPRRRPHRGDPRRDVDHRRARRRLGARRQRRHQPAGQPERLPHDRPRRPRRPRTGRSALAAVQRGDLVPDGLRDGRRRRCATSSTPRSRAS